MEELPKSMSCDGQRRPMERRRPKSKKTSLLASGHFFKIRAPDERRTTGHGQHKTYAMLQVVENIGQGQCLFLSILQHMQHEKFTPFNREKIRSAMDIRMDIVNYVISNWEDYVHGFFNFDDKFQEKIFRYQCTELENIKKCQKYYRKYMSEKSTWATHVELAAATKLYDFKCVLLSVLDEDEDEDPTKMTVTVMNEEIDKRQSRRICFILHTSPGHFRFLKPAGNVLSFPNGNYSLNTVDNVSTATLVKTKKYTETYAKYEFENYE